MTEPREPSYYEIALTNRQVLVAFVLLLACVVIIAFPLYYAFVISTQTVQEVLARPPLLFPTGHALENRIALSPTSA